MMWRAGAAAIEIEVPVGTSLAGYGARTVPSTGELRPLEATALSLSVDDRRALLVGLDLLSVDSALVNLLRDALVAEVEGLVAVFIAASHTHAGPEGFRALGSAEERSDDKAIRESVLFAAREVCSRAVAQEFEASFMYGTSRAGVAANRIDPLAPIDDSLFVATIEGVDGPMATLWHFACHPTVLGPHNSDVSPDLPGEVRALWRASLRADLPVLFFNGAAADVSTRFTRHDQSMDELSRLARGIIDAWPPSVRELFPRPPRVATGFVTLPAAIHNEAASRVRLTDLERDLARLQEESAEESALALQRARVRGATKAIAQAKRGGPRTVEAEICALALGDLVLVGFPGELYAANGMQLRAAFPGRNVLPVGYANDYIGYLPPHGSNGYEADSALVAPGSAEVLIDLAIRLVREVT
jgi:neutral ceramidase